MIEDKKEGSILIIDDEEYILRSLKLTFTIMGYTVIASSGGKEAIEIYQQKSKVITNVILDKSMPDLDGIQTLYKLQSINRNCSVIMMSGYFTTQEEVLLKGMGVKELFNKPFSVHDMIKSIESN